MITERLKNLSAIDECIRWYPPDLQEISDSSIIFGGNRQIDLYVHIPFCKTSCGFCPFNQFPYKNEMVRSYISAMKKEINLIKLMTDLTSNKISTIWIGGGTPSDLDEGALEKVLKAINENFNLDDLKEFTFEVKPSMNSLKDSKLNILKKYNVGRISLGVQSFNEKYLHMLRRGYRPEDAVAVIKKIKDCSFDLNTDMMYRLPGQTLKEVAEDIDKASSLGIDHLSYFPYVAHQGTQLSKRINSGELPTIADRSTYFEMFRTVLNKLKRAGYHQYTPYYFSKDKKCMYHIDRWQIPQLETLGIGAGAFSFLNGWIYANAHNLERYFKAISENKLPIVLGRFLNPAERISRLAVLGIKFFTIRKDEFEKHSGINMDFFYHSELDTLEEQGLIRSHKKQVSCTLLGKAFNNDISMRFSVGSTRGIRQPLPTKIKEAGL